MRVLIEAGPLTVGLDTSRVEWTGATSRALPPSPLRTEESPGETEMWVVHPRVVEQWLTLAADRGPAGLAELMIELDLQDIDGRAA